MNTPFSTMSTPAHPADAAKRKAAAEKWRTHLLVDLKGIEAVPPEEVTSELLAMSDERGVSVAHVLARRGNLNRVPEHLLTPRLFAMFDNAGWTVGYVAAQGKHLKQVPSEVLRGKTFYAGGVGFMAGLTGQLSFTLPSRLIQDPEFWRIADPDGLTVAHGAAQGGHLDHIPEKIKTAELFACAARDGRTVAHSAATGGHLYQVPDDLHTMALYAMADRDGRTVAHMAALSGALHQIPAHLHTMDLYDLRDREMNSVAHLAAQAGHLDQVPRGLKDAKFFDMHNRNFETVESVAYYAGHRHQIPGDYPELAADRSRQHIYAARTGRLPRGSQNRTLLSLARTAEKRMRREGLTEHDLFVEQSRRFAERNALAREQAGLSSGAIAPPVIATSHEAPRRSPLVETDEVS